MLDELLTWLDEEDDDGLLDWLGLLELECDGSLSDDCTLDELAAELSSLLFVGAVSSGTLTSSPYFARGSFAASIKI